MSALLEVSDLCKDFTTRSGLFRKKIHQAVKPVSFTLEAGQTIGFIGQNGSGKSTLARMLAGMVEPHQVRFESMVKSLSTKIIQPVAN